MNYLAHFHLAGDQPGLQLGALLGDYVKGPLQNNFPIDTENGIQLHRLIDAFSDRHPVQQQLKSFLPAESHRYRGIIFDVFCDHYLSLHWHDYHPDELPDFAQQVYQVLDSHLDIMPDKAQEQAWRLIHYDALCCFAELDAVLATLERIAGRLREKNKLLEGAASFARQVDNIEPLFHSFYPELVAFAEEQSRNFPAPQGS